MLTKFQFVLCNQTHFKIYVKIYPGNNIIQVKEYPHNSSLAKNSFSAAVTGKADCITA